MKMKFKILTKSWLLACFSIILSFQSRAQVIPDNTLGSETSVVNSISELHSLIKGGAIRGENLFHSFQEFNVGNGNKVYFTNPDGIANILTRITGSNISEILGTLGVEGNANLFFINPNGIVFGENAVVDVGGSFIATTANEIEFADGQVFSARDTQRPLLEWNAPTGLGLDGNNGNIVIKGTGHNLLITPVRTFISDENSPSSKTEISANTGFALQGMKLSLKEEL